MSRKKIKQIAVLFTIICVFIEATFWYNNPTVANAATYLYGVAYEDSHYMGAVSGEESYAAIYATISEFNGRISSYCEEYHDECRIDGASFDCTGYGYPMGLFSDTDVKSGASNASNPIANYSMEYIEGTVYVDLPDISYGVKQMVRADWLYNSFYLGYWGTDYLLGEGLQTYDDNRYEYPEYRFGVN